MSEKAARAPLPPVSAPAPASAGGDVVVSAAWRPRRPFADVGMPRPGNGKLLLVAIGAGLLGGMAAESYGLVAPFDVAWLLLILGSLVVAHSWDENYGDSKVELFSSFRRAWGHLVQDTKMQLVGVCQAFFESSMYTFVFMWTPVLEEVNNTGAPIPHGFAFAIFMVCCMIGSNCVKMLNRWKPPREYMVIVFGVAALSLTPLALKMGFGASFGGFCLFEWCCGVYFPTWSQLRSEVVPEQSRSAVMNIFRVPLNLIVVAMMGNIDKLDHHQVFTVSVTGLTAAMLAMRRLSRLIHAEDVALEAEHDTLGNSKTQPAQDKPAVAANEPTAEQALLTELWASRRSTLGRGQTAYQLETSQEDDPGLLQLLGGDTVAKEL